MNFADFGLGTWHPKGGMYEVVKGFVNLAVSLGVHIKTNQTVKKIIVENGIKETTPGGYLGSVEMKGRTVHQFESPKQNNEVEDTIQNGVKEK